MKTLVSGFALSDSSRIIHSALTFAPHQVQRAEKPKMTHVTEVTSVFSTSLFTTLLKSRHR